MGSTTTTGAAGSTGAMGSTTTTTGVGGSTGATGSTMTSISISGSLGSTMGSMMGKSSLTTAAIDTMKVVESWLWGSQGLFWTSPPSMTKSRWSDLALWMWSMHTLYSWTQRG